MTMNNNFLNNLLNSISVSGYEEQVQDIVEEEMKDYVDEVRRDEMQNVTCVINPNSDIRIMLSAHADEIGLMISNIREDGRLQVIDRGGIVPSTYPGHAISIKTSKGIVYGVVEAYRELFKEKDLGTKQFLIDIGAKDREDALSYVSIGDPIVLDTTIRKLANDKFTARALDDRLGVYIIMEAIKRAKKQGCTVGVYDTGYDTECDQIPHSLIPDVPFATEYEASLDWEVDTLTNYHCDHICTEIRKSAVCSVITDDIPFECLSE